jgi:ubiquinone/menaquinone biosynthesis C-methylase UbiE
MTNGGKVIGVDKNATLLEYARRGSQSQGIGNVEFVNEDVYDLTFPETSFDLVFCQFLLLFLSHPDKAIERIYSLLKPGGTVCLVEVDHRMVLSYPELPDLVSVQKQFASALTAQ